MEQWYLYCKKADFADISRKFNISPMLARIIRNRDIVEYDSIDKYLNGDLSMLYNPFLLKGMDEGVKLTAKNIKSKKKIRVVGDYDVDGVCSSYILKTFIEKAGGQVDVRLPDRILEGYGMNESMADEAFADEISLIITCDNGVSAIEAVNKAREFGIDVIITDHHETPEVLPLANVIIDPKQPDCNYPFSEICGAGVAYKFVQGLNEYMGIHENELLDELLQFAGMATVADIVPLQDENRIFVREGIKRLRKSNNVGLNALIESKGINKTELCSYHIGFVLGPCINSAGRLKNAMLAFNLLDEKNPEVAAKIAETLSDLNAQRKELTQKQSENAISIIEKKRKEKQGSVDIVLVIYLPDAHESVAGIIAGRIKDEYNRPTLVITQSEEGLKGSGRSIEQYNLIEELSKREHLFSKYGGHAKACGFTLEQRGSAVDTVALLAKELNENCLLKEEDLIQKIWIDMQLPFKYITEDFVEELEKLEPYGLNNEKPVFAERDLLILSTNVVGKTNNVLKILFEDRSGYRVEGIMFGDTNRILQEYDRIKVGGISSILYYPSINNYKGFKTAQAIIKSITIDEQSVK